jgi:plastocyanin
MATPDTLDDIWKDGLDALVSAQALPSDPRGRVEQRVTRRRRQRVSRTSAAVLVVALAVVAGVATLRTDHGTSTPATHPHVTRNAFLERRQTVTIELADDGVKVQPAWVTESDTTIRYVDARTRQQSTTGYERADVRGPASAPPTNLPLGGSQPIILFKGRYTVTFPGLDCLGNCPQAHFDVRPQATPGPLSVRDITIPSAQLRYEPAEITAPEGTIVLRLVNAGPGTHVLTVAQLPQFSLGVERAGEVATAKVVLRPGRYTLYCVIPGHRVAGMQATLVVTRK